MGPNMYDIFLPNGSMVQSLEIMELGQEKENVKQDLNCNLIHWTGLRKMSGYNFKKKLSTRTIILKES